MKLYTQAINEINASYLKRYNINLAFVVIASEWFNPIIKDYKNGVIDLEEACNLINKNLNN